MKPKNKNAKRVLCLCRGGNSRSVGAAFTLKYCFGHDAVAIGFEGNSPETLRMMCEWAEHIIVMKAAFITKIPPEFLPKLSCCDVGGDRYFQIHPDLIQQVGDFAETKDFLKFVGE